MTGVSINTRIGFIGTGLMGLPLCQRLLAAGFQLHVWNRSPEKCSPLQKAGAQLAGSIAELVKKAEIIFLCVSDTAAVEELLHRDAGLLSGLTAGQIVIDLSSIDPLATQQFATEVERKKAHWIDAPVSGGVAGAEAGTLVVMAGGDAAIIDRVRPLLAHVSQRVTHMGANGAGQVTKICNQLIVAANAVLVAEAVALAEKAGVDAGKLAPALAGGFADSKPFQLLVPRMSTRQFEPVQWRVQTLLKDLDMATALSRRQGVATPLAASAAQLLRLHGQQGLLDKDLSSVVTLFGGEEKPC
jgi:3-hydroxyisobutyrate dehydrogenase